MDPSFLQLSRTVHQEKLQAAAKEQHFRNVATPGEETRIVTRRSIKWIVLLVMLAMLALNG